MLNQKLSNVQDANLIRREIYNPNNFAITFVRMPERLQYVLLSKISPGPHKVTCVALGRCILNHGYYRPETPLEKGQPFNVIEIYGRNIGKGHTKPSRPEIN